MVFRRAVGKVLLFHVGKQIPVCSEMRSVFAQPFSLNRFSAEGILTRQPSCFEGLETLSELSSPVAVVLGFGNLGCKGNSKAQSILPVTYFGIPDQPMPVHVTRLEGSPVQSALVGNTWRAR